MTAIDKQRALTELEGATLSVIVRDGPCTAYAVKELFRASTSEFWSGSAGSIYPVMKRLQERGLVTAESGATGKRGHLSFRITPAGRRAFTRWMIDPGRVAGLGFDPLRTRLVFLGQLSRAKRENFRKVVGDVLDELPPATDSNDAWFEQLDQIWRSARRRALEEFMDVLDEKD